MSENRLLDVLHGKEENYILPFVWMHGAPENELRRLMQAVHESGIGAVCLEARPHPDFAGERWWRDVDIVLDEAMKRNMKVWILDDAHFPTGMANGGVVNQPRHLKRISLVEKHYTVTGPQKGTKLDITHSTDFAACNGTYDMEKYQDRLECVVLAKMCRKDGQMLIDSATVVTDQVENGWLYLDLPEGDWCVFVLISKLHTAAMLGDGVSLLNPDSVRVLIDEVYEKHYQHYAAYFGSTICGFFSDEPGFFNLADRGYGTVNRTGENSEPLPWTEEVLELLKEEFGDETESLLPLLFGQQSTRTGLEKAIRAKYMDILSRLYGKYFSGQLGDWCRAHGVEYIGHIVEDGPGCMRIGQSAAHFFRALRPQDMTGIDIVLNCLLPDRVTNDNDFYHYGLAQLANSLAHQEPRHRGRSVCEIFGAYGWSEGVTLMKWMADHMLTGGLNHFVPHAFTDNPFPDPDCPPHFWAKGNHPQYPFMSVLFHYMNRLSHLFSGGVPLIENAVLFEAESDWLGDTTPFYQLGKALMFRQVPYHVVCLDDLENAAVENGCIRVGSMAYKHLFVGKAAHMNPAAAATLYKLHEAGAKVLFVDGKPLRWDGSPLAALEELPVISEEQMVRMAVVDDPLRITAGHEAELRRYSYRHSGMDIHMFQNASAKNAVDVQVEFTKGCAVLRYDAMAKKLYAADTTVHQHLAPLETVIWVETADSSLAKLCEPEQQYAGKAAYTGSYRISRCAYNEDGWESCGETTELYDIDRKYPGFAGCIRYEFAAPANAACVQLENATEAMELFCDGKSLGKRIAPPYRWALPENGKDSRELCLEVSTTLVNAVPDPISCEIEIAPTGFMGSVWFLSK